MYLLNPEVRGGANVPETCDTPCPDGAVCSIVGIFLMWVLCSWEGALNTWVAGAVPGLQEGAGGMSPGLTFCLPLEASSTSVVSSGQAQDLQPP